MGSTSVGGAFRQLRPLKERAHLTIHHALQIEWIDAERLEPESKVTDATTYDEAWAMLRGAHGVLVPGEPRFFSFCFSRERLYTKYGKKNKTCRE